MSSVSLFWLSHFHCFSRFLLEVSVLVVSLKTSFHSRNLQGICLGMGKSNTNCPTLGGWTEMAHGSNGALKDAWTVVARDTPWHFGIDVWLQR